MNKKTLIIGIGVLAAAGIGIYLYRRSKKTEQKSNMVTTPDEAFQQGVASHWDKLAKDRYSTPSNLWSVDGDEESSESEESNFAAKNALVKYASPRAAGLAMPRVEVAASNIPVGSRIGYGTNRFGKADYAGTRLGNIVNFRKSGFDSGLELLNADGLDLK